MLDQNLNFITYCSPRAHLGKLNYVAPAPQLNFSRSNLHGARDQATKQMKGMSRTLLNFEPGSLLVETLYTLADGSKTGAQTGALI